MYETAVAVSVITGIIEVLKRTFLPAKFAPITALVLGIAFSVFANNVFNFDVVLFGAITGLSSMGLYDGAKITANKGKEITTKILAS